MTGGTGQSIEINAFVFETGMLLFLLAMTAETGVRLVLLILDWIGLGVNLVAT
jgi:hypothetical protein